MTERKPPPEKPQPPNPVERMVIYSLTVMILAGILGAVRLFMLFFGSSA